MSMYKQIISKDNYLIKKAVCLAKDNKSREKEQQALIYGKHLVLEAIRYGLLNQIFVVESCLNKYLSIWQEYDDITVNLLTEQTMQKINILDSAIDIAAIIDIKPSKISDELFKQDCILLEKIQDPGNLGTILRVVRASGVNNIFISKDSVDIYNPKVLRASQGIQFGLNVFTNFDFTDFFDKYQGQLLAMTPHTEQSLYNEDLSKATAFIFGNEGMGLSQEILGSHVKHISIPLQGNSESLNLAMAVTVSAFELSRQRLIR